jgi:ribonuclease T2
MPSPRIALALVVALLSACDESPAVTHYVLALSWQPTFCERNRDKPECRALDDGDYAAHHLSLHGLWPSGAVDKGPSYCGVSGATANLDMPQQWCALPEPALTDSTRDDLRNIMPGVQSCLDRHEWIKHGTCSGLPAETYFAETVRLTAAVQATPLGALLSAEAGQRVDRRRFFDAFEESFGPGTTRALSLVCREGDLLEIRIALKLSAMFGGLDRDDLYLDGQPAGSCPATVRIDQAG